MPTEKMSLLKMLIGDEPGITARIKHNLTGANEGEWGEKCIVKLLQNRTTNGNIFQNVYVPSPNGTTEVDIILTGKTGIYVFESKAYGGKIYGKFDNMNWIQYIGRAKTTFYNPIKQNANHCLHLSNALNISQENILSFIVFENRADLQKVILPSQSNFVVCNRNQLYEKLSDVISAREQVFSDDELAAFNSQLKQWIQADSNTKNKHIEQIQNSMHGDKCPFCGKQLVERKGKHGSFIGCTGYPQCKYTRQL